MIEGSFTHEAEKWKYDIDYKAKVIDIDKVPYDDEIRKLCTPRTKYCPDIGYELCPPRAPKFVDLKEGYDQMLVLIFVTSLQDIMKRDISERTRNFYIYIKNSDGVLGSKISKRAISIESELDGYTLGEGSGKHSKRPSLEASGINVVKLIEDTFGHKIQYYLGKGYIDKAKGIIEEAIDSRFLKFIPTSNIYPAKGYKGFECEIEYLTKVVGIMFKSDHSNNSDKVKNEEWLKNMIEKRSGSSLFDFV